MQGVLLEGDFRKPIGELQGELDLGLGGASLEQACHRADRGVRLGADRRALAGRARLGENAVEQALHAPQLLLGELEEALAELGVVLPLGKQIDERLERDQRVADLVGDLGRQRAERRQAIEASHLPVQACEPLCRERRRHRHAEAPCRALERRQRARPYATERVPGATGEQEGHRSVAARRQGRGCAQAVASRQLGQGRRHARTSQVRCPLQGLEGLEGGLGGGEAAGALEAGRHDGGSPVAAAGPDGDALTAGGVGETHDGVGEQCGEVGVLLEPAACLGG